MTIATLRIAPSHTSQNPNTFQFLLVAQHNLSALFLAESDCSNRIQILQSGFRSRTQRRLRNKIHWKQTVRRTHFVCRLLIISGSMVRCSDTFIYKFFSERGWSVRGQILQSINWLLLRHEFVLHGSERFCGRQTRTNTQQKSILCCWRNSHENKLWWWWQSTELWR